MGIIIDGTTGIDLGHTPVSNGTNYEVEGNLNITGVGSRITGDFSNATHSNRCLFQTNVINSLTSVGIIPNGTATDSKITVTNSSDVNNTSLFQLGTNQTEHYFFGNKIGTGTYLPIVFLASNVERMRIDTGGNVGIGIANGTSKLEVAGSGANNSGARATYEGTIKINEGGITSVNQSGGIEFKGSVFESGYGGKIVNTDGGNMLFAYRNNSALFKEAMRIDAQTGNVLVTGSGGSVQQFTSKSTTVLLNKPTGTIIMHNAALAAGTSAQFSVLNSIISATDTVLLSITPNGGTITTNYNIWTESNNGSFNIYIKNISAGSLSDALKINFTIIKGAIA